MPDTIRTTAKDRIWSQLDRIARLDRGFSPAFIQAIQAFLTAAGFRDEALMKSHMQSAFELTREAATNDVQERLALAKQFREAWLNIRESMKMNPAESYDEEGKELGARLDELLGRLNILVEPIQKLRERGYEVELGQQLGVEIEGLQQLKQDIFKSWPWSNQALPPVNRTMVAESRAAIARGEGEPIKDLIDRLGGITTKNH